MPSRPWSLTWLPIAREISRLLYLGKTTLLKNEDFQLRRAYHELEDYTFNLLFTRRTEAMSAVQQHVATRSLLTQSEQQAQLTMTGTQPDAQTPVGAMLPRCDNITEEVKADFEAAFSSSSQQRHPLRQELASSRVSYVALDLHCRTYTQSLEEELAAARDEFAEGTETQEALRARVQPWAELKDQARGFRQQLGSHPSNDKQRC